MKTYKRNEHVPAGLYWDPDNWEILTVSGKAGGRLPVTTGDDRVINPEEAMVVRMNPVAGLLMAPTLGGLMVCFLPFIGFALLAEHVGKKIIGATKGVTEDVASTLLPEVRHSHSYFLGKKNKKKTEKK